MLKCSVCVYPSLILSSKIQGKSDMLKNRKKYQILGNTRKIWVFCGNSTIKKPHLTICQVRYWNRVENLHGIVKIFYMRLK